MNDEESKVRNYTKPKKYIEIRRSNYSWASKERVIQKIIKIAFRSKQSKLHRKLRRLLKAQLKNSCWITEATSFIDFNDQTMSQRNVKFF